MHARLARNASDDPSVKQLFFTDPSQLGQLVLESHAADCSHAAFGGTVNVVSANDRRIQNRAAIELNVEYKRLNTFFADYTRNISKGGTFIRTDRPLEVNTEFVFALTIKNIDEPLRLHGRVRWIVRPADATPESQAGMGIEFMYRDDAERRETEAIVEKLMVEELGEDLAARMLGHDVEIR
jgi:type IV pilus assembly protein PilZ